MGELPDFKSSIADAYNKPIIQPIVAEGQRLQEQYLPTIFDTFATMGTGAGDVSAAAKLQHIGRNLGRLSGQLGANRDVQNFYTSQIQDLAGVELSRWQTEQQKMKDLYTMAFQREEAERAEAARRASAAAAAAQMQAINDLMAGGGGGGVEEVPTDPVISRGTTYDDYVNYKKALGQSVPTEAYWKSAYNPQRMDAGDMALSKVYNLLTDDPNAPWYKNFGNAFAGMFAAPGAGLYALGTKALRGR
jgi:hypothetical protein